jgi:hypothetical protein
VQGGEVSLLEAALTYALNGWPVFPLIPGQKQPLGALAPHGVKDATTDIAQVTEWWTVEPEANIGVATGGGRFVLDLDSFEARERLEAAGIVIPADAPVATTGKGAHIWFAGTMGNRTGVVEKVDVRGDGGYVVAPPSVHPNGGTYTWASGEPFGKPLPLPPPALLSLLGNNRPQATPAQPAGDWVSQLLGGVGEGGRDDACTRLAGYFLGKGLPAEAVQAVLRAWAALCTPPFPESDVRKCVESIASREGGAPTSQAPRAADLVQATLDLIAGKGKPARSTGLKDLDQMLGGGFEPGTTTLLGGRPGTGKTALMLQIARHTWESGAGVLFVTLEMSGTRLLRRVLTQMTKIPLENLKHNDLIDGQRTLLAQAAEELRGAPFWIETRARTVEGIGSVLAEYAPGQIGLVMLDYLQKLADPGGRLDGRQRVEHVSDALIKLAVSSDIPFVVASSLSRPEKANANWRPSLGSLRESGQLEHDADNVVLLYREDGPALEVNVAKQRDGAVATGALFFDGPTLTIR